MTNENKDAYPEVPETVEPAIEIIKSHETQRRRAFDLAYQAYKDAASDEEKVAAFSHLVEMDRIHEEYKQQFPEIFGNKAEE